MFYRRKRCVEVLLLVLMLSLSSWEGMGQEINSPQKGILFISDRSGQPELYMMQPDGSDVHLFVNSDFEVGGELRAAVLSPDGHTLAFVSRKDRGNHPTNAIFLLDLNTGTITALPNDVNYDSDFPIWSPDSSHLTYLAHGKIGAYGELYSFDLVSRETRLLTDSRTLRDVFKYPQVGMMSLSQSPDGQHFALWIQTGFPEGDNFLAVVNSDGTHPRRITANNEKAALPAWQWALYFVCKSSDHDAICALNLQTSKIQTLPNWQFSGSNGQNTRWIERLDVSDEGQILLQFVGNPDIYRYEPQEGNLTNLTAGSHASNSAPVWINFTATTGMSN